MRFTFPILAAIGTALACVPILIHLLNRRRRKRVEWAAMDFLLKSERKNRTWVRLSEWLLLAARVLAVGLAGLLAATPRTADLLEGFFGSEPARHVVLLDDTGSMQRRDADQTAWDEATGALGRLAATAASNGDEVVVLRYSDVLSDRAAATIVGQEDATTTDPAGWQATSATIDSIDAIGRLRQAVQEGNAATTYAYILSDFAETTHGDRDGWAYPLQGLASESAGVVLAACGDHDAGNLEVSSLTLAPGPVAAGVEMRVEIEVTNHSAESAPAVAVALRRNGQPLASIEVGPFEPGQAKRVETAITLQGVGLHTLDASLPGDRLPADDTRWLAIEAAASQAVVLVDPSETGIESRVFAAALRPIGKTRSGWSPTRVQKLDADTLADAAALFLLDVERLTERETALVRDFVAAGGGVLMVLGPRTDVDWFNRSIAGGGLAGSPPMTTWQIGPPASTPTTASGEPMLTVSDHPAMRVLGGEGNGFLPLVRPLVSRRLADETESNEPLNVSLPTEASPPALASFTDGRPLVLESRFGAGRLIGMLTTAATGDPAAPPWSNLASLPIFPVLANDLAGWLAQERLKPILETIGEKALQQPPARSTLRRWDESGELREVAGLSDNLPLMPASPGVYRRVLGGMKEPAFAASIASAESDLAAPRLDVLQSRWGDTAKVGRASQLFREEATPSSRVPLYIAAALLLGLLVVERWLAYKTSYVSSAATPAQRRASR